MKKLVSVCFAFVLAVAGILSFRNIFAASKTGSDKIRTSAISCAADASPGSIPLFFPVESAFAPMQRKNIYSLSTAEINAIKTGIAQMKNTPASNPTSWTYQAAIHGTFTTPVKIAWNTCQHNQTFFLSWHRMYLYFFERILRKKSGSPTLTLPFWDYQSNPVLHPAYRANAAGNPLYDGTRYLSINNGGALPSAIMTSFTNALNNNTSFFPFSSAVYGPHGSVHIAVGGDMQRFETAGLDPCFWLHHTNIDRLWEQWLRKCGGRANPVTNNTWMTQAFTFFDENGTAVQMTGSQIVRTAQQLNYFYPFPLAIPCNIQATLAQDIRWRRLIITPPVRISSPTTKASFRSANADSLQLFLREANVAEKRISARGASPDRFLIELEGLKINTLPEGVVEVYINLKAGEKPGPKSKSFVDVLNLFTGSSSHHQGKEEPLRIDITAAAEALGLKTTDLRNVEVTFVVRGNTVRGKAVETKADIEIKGVAVGVLRAEK